MTTKTETNHAGGFLIADLPSFASRKVGKLNSGQNLIAAAVLGQILVAAAAVAGTNTGTGAVTVGAAIGPSTVVGTYKLVCVAAASNAGTFNFYAPDGTLIRQITVAGGAHVSEHLTITIADATDFIVGDSFTIAVTGGDYEALNTAGTNGTQIPAGILFDSVNASSADKNCVVVYRDAVVEAAELLWPNGISSPAKAAAVARLESFGFTFR